MYLPIEIKHIELVGRGTNVTLFEPKSFKYPMQLTYHQIVSDIEFATTIKQRPVDV